VLPLCNFEPARKTKCGWVIFGGLWVKQARSAVLELPSAIIPIELNYLLNPAHPEFKKIAIGKPVPFSFDPRFL